MRTFKQILCFIAAITAGAIITSCSNTEENIMEASQDTQVNTRAVGTKTPKLTAYIETNDINPLNAGEYYFSGTNPQEQVIDHVILFASNIRGTATTAQLHHNQNQTYILNHRSTLIAPLQQKGIKVLLGLLGDHTGVGFANMTQPMINSFAQQIADCVNQNGLDGADFDDEWAKYGLIPSLPASTAKFEALIQKVRQLLPGKLITVFHFGGYTNFNATTLNCIDYMWSNFGCGTPPPGLPLSKFAKLAVNYDPQNQIPANIANCVRNYTGVGAIMTFNLRDWNCSSIMNYFAPYVWNNRTVTRTNVSHPKNY